MKLSIVENFLSDVEEPKDALGQKLDREYLSVIAELVSDPLKSFFHTGPEKFAARVWSYCPKPRNELKFVEYLILTHGEWHSLVQHESLSYSSKVEDDVLFGEVEDDWIEADSELFIKKFPDMWLTHKGEPMVLKKDFTLVSNPFDLWDAGLTDTVFVFQSRSDVTHFKVIAQDFEMGDPYL